MATRSKKAALLLAAASLAGALSACGHRAAEAVGPKMDTSATTTPAPPPRVIDLRFKGVGDLSSNLSSDRTDVLASKDGGGLWLSFDSAAGSPLSLGNGLCSTVICGWSLILYALPSGVARLGTAYRTGQITDLPSFFNAGQSDTVITSLDLEPSVGVFALSEFTTSQSAGYRIAQGAVRLGDLQALASAAAAAKRVITAVAFDEGQVLYVSYTWDHDTTQGYEAKVVQATLSTADTAAKSLAAEGYIITAFGGDSANGLILVGTRLRGDTQPRGLVINSDGVPISTGYAPVAYFFGPAADGTTTLIIER